MFDLACIVEFLQLIKLVLQKKKDNLVLVSPGMVLIKQAAIQPNEDLLSLPSSSLLRSWLIYHFGFTNSFPLCYCLRSVSHLQRTIFKCYC